MSKLRSYGSPVRALPGTDTAPSSARRASSPRYVPSSGVRPKLLPPPAPIGHPATWVVACPPAPSTITFELMLLSSGFEPYPGALGLFVRRFEASPEQIADILQPLVDIGATRLAVFQQESLPSRMSIDSGLAPARSVVRRIRARWLVPLFASGQVLCEFQTIYSSSGLPYAECAMVSAESDDGASIDEAIIMDAAEALGIIASIGHKVRVLALRSFGGADGVPATVRAWLPWYCMLGERRSTRGVILPECRRQRMDPRRVIAELAPARMDRSEVDRAFFDLEEQGCKTALHVTDLDAQLDLVTRLRPDHLRIPAPHLMRRPNLDQLWPRLLGATKSQVVVCDVSTVDDVALLAGRGGLLFQGPAVSESRLLG